MNKYLQVIRKTAIDYKGSYSDEGVNPYETAMYECNGYIEKLEKQNKKYREVLEQYANQLNWSGDIMEPKVNCHWYSRNNGYELAQEALKEGEK
jgi:hypothetical protein